MPRVSKKNMEYNREAIIDIASRLFKQYGYHSVSINDIMAAVGLTHGGFYKHFSSKDELIAIASKRALEQHNEQWQAINLESTDKLEKFITSYLSTSHRDNLQEGCFISALVNDVAREALDKPVCDIYLKGIKDILDKLESLSEAKSEAKNEQARYQDAIVKLSMLLGALTLSRATKGDKLSDDFLEIVKQTLLTPLK